MVIYTNTFLLFCQVLTWRLLKLIYENQKNPYCTWIFYFRYFSFLSIISFITVPIVATFCKFEGTIIFVD